MPHIKISDKLVGLVGGALLLGIMLSAWVPLSCPLLRKAVIGCPVTGQPYVAAPTTPAEREIARIPSQKIPSPIAYFSPASDAERSQTSVSFEFREQDLSVHPTVFLQARIGGAFTDIALVTQPLLENLNWPAASDGKNYRLYQRDDLRFSTIEQFTASLPAANVLAADSVAARRYGLKAGQYQDLEGLGSLEGIQYVLTSYQPPRPDGDTWHIFRQTLNLSAAEPDESGKLNLAVRIPSYKEGETFLLGTIGIDYARAYRPLE